MAKKDKKEIKSSKDKTSFMKSFKAELKKVVWPTPKQLFNNTVAVLAIALITTLIVFVLDITFESINKYGVNKVKEAISNSSVQNSTENTEANSTDNTTSVENNDNAAENVNNEVEE